MSAELKINETLPVLAFNFEQLKGWATEIAERYAGVVVTEEAIADVKRDMADINKAKKAVDDARKEAVRRVSEPIRSFESQIKEVCAIFDTAYAKLGEQVKAFEDAQRAEKRSTVLELIGECFADAFGAHGEWPDFEIPMQEKWLNKTTSLKSIREEVAAIIRRHVEEEARKAALEQARQDRAAAIESHVAGLNTMHGFSFPVSRFFGERNLDLTVPLEVVLSGISAFIENENTQRERQKAKDAAPAVPSASPGAAVKSTPQPENAGQSSADPLGKAEAPAQTRIMSIVFEYPVGNEAKVKACLETLKPLCVKFGVRTRQE